MNEQRRRLYDLLGDLPPRDRPVAADELVREEREGYTLEVLMLDLNGLEPVPAYFTRPHGLSGPAPVVVYNHAHGGDYVLGKDEFLRGRIAIQGLSMGSTMAWWHAALDERVRVCVDICCLTDFQALIETRGLDGHGIYYYVPGLLKEFTTAQINALICPRAHLSLAGLWDKLTPPAGLDRIDAALREQYDQAGVPERWQLVRYPTGHFETHDMRARILQF